MRTRWESVGYRFEFSNGLSATGVLFHSVYAAADAPVTLLIADAGMKTSLSMTSPTTSAADGACWCWTRCSSARMFPARMHVPLARSRRCLRLSVSVPWGLEAAQVNAVTRWLGLEHDHGSPSPRTGVAAPVAIPPAVQMITIGPRAETVALTAAALEPALFRSRRDAQVHRQL